MNVLINSYACGPNWGSEVGMGWHWVTALSNHCQLYVITESGFEDDIKNILHNLDLKYMPVFYFVNIGDKGRELFWQQGSFKFYKHYKNWQNEAFKLANDIIKTQKIDIIHQLNMIGFREPGFLWQIDKPYVLGPLGGIDNFPNAFMGYLPFKNRIYSFLKNHYSNFQFKYLKRFHDACKKAEVIFTATNDGFQRLKKIYPKKVILLNETGCEVRAINNKDKNFDGILKVMWVGRMEERKALDLAIESLSNIKDKINFEFTIIGDGPMEDYYKKLIQKKNIQDQCKWKGRIQNDEVQYLMKKSHLFLFTSLREGTPHVVTEALQNGLPVICHNACGHGSVVTNDCGLKVDMISPKISIDFFSECLVKLNKDRDLLKKMSDNAIKRASEVSWENKAKEMFKIYKTFI